MIATHMVSFQIKTVQISALNVYKLLLGEYLKIKTYLRLYWSQKLFLNLCFSQPVVEAFENGDFWQ